MGRRKGGCVPDVGNDDGALGNKVAVEDVFLTRGMGYTKGGDWVPSEHFLEHGVDVGEIILVGEVRESGCSYDPVDFFLSLLLDGRVQGHGHEEA